MAFKTIMADIEEELVEKRSKFIANLFYVSDVEQVEQKMQEISKLHRDARHHCYAYRILQGDTIVERASDDGEPSGTAGMPMLTILNKNNLCNVLAVVTRYFGGILLGTGGLVRAYSGVVMNALEKANLVEEIMGTQLTIEIEYASLDKFIYFCRKNEIYIEKIEYQETVFCTIVVKEEEQISLITNREENSLSILKCEILGKKILRNTIKEK
mgnify:FL=1